MPDLRRGWGADEQGRFPCPIPGHKGSALIGEADEGPEEPRLLCCSGRWRSLAEVWASRAYGHSMRLSNIELAVWNRRLLFDLGRLQPPPVVVPPLPVGSAPWLAQLRDGFRLLVELRWSDYEPRPVAFSIGFASPWCGVTEWQAREGRPELQRFGVMVPAGRKGRSQLYLPGGYASDNGVASR